MRQENWSAYETDHARFFSQRFYKAAGACLPQRRTTLKAKWTAACRGMGSTYVLMTKADLLKSAFLRVHWLSLIQERVRRYDHLINLPGIANYSFRP